MEAIVYYLSHSSLCYTLGGFYENINASDSYKGSLSSLEVSKVFKKDLKKFLKVFLLKRYQWLMEEKEQHKLLLNP